MLNGNKQTAAVCTYVCYGFSRNFEIVLLKTAKKKGRVELTTVFLNG